MKLRVLGCSGGIGAGLRTTSFLLDDDVLIDAGTGVGDLSLDELSHIKHIFITHSHLDHVAFIPFIIDSIFERITDPVSIYGLPETIKALQEHIFNWTIWPDFASLPTKKDAVVRYHTMSAGDVISIGGRQIEIIPVHHVVPSAGYRVQSGTGSFAFSGDTTTNDSFWDALNKHNDLDLLIVETSFTNRQSNIAQLSHHYCPASLASDLAKLKHSPELYLSHLKPGEEIAILAEVRVAIQRLHLQSLVGGEIFYI